ncbi:M24 family metallopeptidase [Faecalicatena contorta]|uniref:M24 family metallopeptidase n=1 Tax=Faecalicatena contorta TaxID=39482 RepID=UPI001F174A91|nr:M24 family metallopeptidase [Faecalicatena contorta]MCF2682194.1 M24 family metallopeptidase [Faecalicatena contorta]
MSANGNYGSLYLDLYRVNASDIDRPAQRFLRYVQQHFPYLQIGNANILIRELRLIKQPCEIKALREAEKITKTGILAMMKSSRPGMYEYQYKAEFDHALGQFGPKGPGFPSIISAGKNNFCIHYYSYHGQAQDGDMILNDVGAEIRRYNCERLKDAGALDSYDEIGTYMWHGGAHHIGFDVHDVVRTPDVVAPGMAFCIDVGIYHEEWGIGFRLEDNCLVTEDGCENLSADIPRTIEDIEAVMNE